MNVLKRQTLQHFWDKYPEAEQPLKAWFAEAQKAGWESPQDIKNAYASASFVAGNRVVFNIGGNKFRLVVKIKYECKLCLIRFIGTHKEYDKIDVSEV